MTNDNVKEKSGIIYSQFFSFLSLLFAAIIITIILVIIFPEILWFQKLGYLSVFFIRLEIKISLFFSTFILSLLFLFGNLRLAQKQSWRGEEPHLNLPPQSPVLKLRLLLPIVIAFCLLIAVSLVYHTQVAHQIWRLNLRLPNLNPPLPSPLEISLLKQLLGQISNQIWQLGVVIIILFLLLWKTKFWLKTITIYQAIVFGLVISGNWIRVLRYFYVVPFDKQDPLFGHDLSFYVFKLPLWQLADFWLKGLLLYAIIAVTLTYLLANKSISEGKFIGFSRFQLRHLYGLGGGLMLVLAGDHWLNRYLLLFSTKGVVYGAGYTDVQLILPKETICAVVSLLIGIWLIAKALTGVGKRNILKKKGNSKTWLPFSPLPLAIYFAIYFGGIVLAEVVQNTVVEPNELALEEPYIINNIHETRAAFNLDKIEVKTFDPEGNLTTEVLKKNYLTIHNIRLWDTRPILQTNRQLQQIRPYYAFPDADIDRYTIKVSTTSAEKEQVIIAARELDYKLVPKQAKTWVNEHLVYTHGYGFTLSPVNRVAEGGLPYYYVKDIGTPEDPGGLQTSSPLIRDSIPIGIPRIYYGQFTDTYVMTNTRVQEFDFPSGDENVYNTYEGKGGINIASPWRRFLFALYLQDWRMLLTRDFTPETRLMFRRNINERVKAIAPFLYYDRDPYLVVARGGEGKTDHLYWFIDAYTITDHYPYSDPGENQFNYIRNSVKILINAENGKTTFYIADDSDPLIQAWQKIFPSLFQTLEAMPINLKSHIRYPVDLFSTQSERLLTYHMTNPQVFYNREDLWQIPEEIYGNEVLSIEPYYLIMKLPIAISEEFILLHPYTPISRPNLIAWLAARCDGEEYGKLLLYQFPKQKLVYGPDQVEALINQDPVISGQISLWNRQGSRAIQGNLLVIPIEQSLLYVEPLYLEAEKNSLPTLVRVIVVYENKIIMANSLQNALNAIFEPEKSDRPAIIRPLQEIPLPLLEQ
jgi:uncharacterized membrane protein (UPF0182 family)